MGLNLDKLRSQLKNLDESGTTLGGGGKHYKPKDGDVVRVLSFPDGDLWKEKWLVYNVAEEPFLCPQRMFNEESPIQKFAFELIGFAKETGNETLKKAMIDILSKQRFYSWVLLRGKESEGPKIWSYSERVMKLIKSIVQPKPEVIRDITSLTDGRDLFVSITKQDKFNMVGVSPDDPSPAFKSDEQKEKFISKLDNLENEFPRKTPKECEDLLKKHIEEKLTEFKGLLESFEEKDDLEYNAKKGTSKSKIDQKFEALNDDEVGF